MAVDINTIIRAPVARASQPAATAVKDGTIIGISDESGNLERSNGAAWSDFGPQQRNVVKPSDESVTSSTTLQDDDHLKFAIAANEKWVARITLQLLSASAIPDFKFTIAVPAGATGNFKESDGNTVNSFAATVVVQLTAATNKVLHIDIAVVNSTTAGDVKLQWAQNTSDANAVSVKAFSTLLAQKE